MTHCLFTRLETCWPITLNYFQLLFHHCLLFLEVTRCCSFRLQPSSLAVTAFTWFSKIVFPIRQFHYWQLYISLRCGESIQLLLPIIITMLSGPCLFPGYFI